MYERILNEMSIKGIRFIADLERKAGVSPGTVRNIRYGHTPTSGNLVKIAEALDVSVQFLLTGETDTAEAEESSEITMKRKKIYSILEGLSPEQFENAIHYLTYLKSMEAKK
ncbi:MAG: helix-turn-helix transcriptional regulator [Clostridia bacterium]|nr:helix-turn-helix transcriptional regulator [Clostridia bacterium]